MNMNYKNKMNLIKAKKKSNYKKKFNLPKKMNLKIMN